MKAFINLIILIFTTFNLSNCASKKQAISFDEIKYEALTRGSRELIVLKGDLLEHKTNNDSKSIKLNQSQLEKLNEELSKINLEDISGLKSPTNKRAYDGALSASVSIKKDGKNFTSSTFDDTHPPKELEAICKLLFECANK